MLILHQAVPKRHDTKISDPKTPIKVFLHESYINSLQTKKTYLLQNLKIKANENKRYLNTAMDEKFVFKQIAPFKQPLAEVDNPGTSTIYWYNNRSTASNQGHDMSLT